MIAAAVAGGPAGTHRAQPVLEAERGAEDVDLEHGADVLGSTSVTRLEISTPALLTRMSRPPKSVAAAVTALSQLASSVTSSSTNAVILPEGVGDLGARVDLEVGHDDACPGRGERSRHPLAQALGSSGDEGRAAAQV